MGKLDCLVGELEKTFYPYLQAEVISSVWIAINERLFFQGYGVNTKHQLIVFIIVKHARH